MGKSALEGLKGLKEVKNGFKGLRETNTVIYDAAMISPAEMVSVLKGVGTYLGLAEK